MSGAILIPYRGTPGSERERNLRFVFDWYRPLDLPVTLGCVPNGPGPFNRAASRNAAAAGAGDWDVALFSDADCVAPLDSVREAFRLARETGLAYMPSDIFFSLSERGTKAALLSPWKLDRRRSVLPLLKESVVGESVMPSGALVVPRAAFEAVGGYEEGFTGWGWEDTAFLFDLRRLGLMSPDPAVYRLPGMLIHLWHPRGGLRIEHTAENRALAAKHPVVLEY